MAPAAQEGLGDAEPDPAGAAGDQHDTSGQVEGERHGCYPTKQMLGLSTRRIRWPSPRAAPRRHPRRHDGRTRRSTRSPCRAGSTSPPRSTRPSADLDTKVVVLRAEGRGFNAGVDIKEMQHTTGFDALIGANKGCFAAFKAVYECAVPVVAAVNGFCLGGGVGLVGNADCIVASDDAYFGVPEVNQGALGAATHMARLVPQHLMRTLYFTAPHDQGRRPRAVRQRPRGGPARPSSTTPRSGRRRDRRQGHPGDPGRQGGAQRHRPDRRQQELPVRAGLHVGAQPRRGHRRAARRVRRHREGARQ